MTAPVSASAPEPGRAPGRTAAIVSGLAALVLGYLWLRHRELAALQEALGVGQTPLHDFEGFFYPMGEVFFSRQRPIEGFFYSPTAAAGFAVLAWLPYPAAAWLWGLSLVAGSLVLAVAPRWLGEERWRWPALLTLAAYPLWHGLKFGQVSVPLTLAVVLSLVAYRRGRVRTSAAWLAAAIALKYYAVIFAVFFVARRDRAALAWTAAFTVFALLVVPAVLIGPVDTLEFYRAVAESVRAHFGSGIADPNSQSLPSVAHRLAAAWSLPWLTALAGPLAIVATGGGLVWAWRVARDDDPEAWTHAFVVLFGLTPLWVATSWPHYFVYVPLGCAVVWKQLRGRSDAGSIAWWVGHVGAGAAAVAVSMPWFDFLGDRHQFVRHGYLLGADLCLLAGLAAARMPRGRPPTAAREATAGWGPWLGAIATIAIATVGRLRLEPYDDAYFFKRFALNVLAGGGFSWNIADGPVHGNTSQLYQVLVTMVVAADPVHALAWMRVFAAGCLAVMVVVLARRFEPASRAPVLLLALSPVALATVGTGMETALVLALESAFVVAVCRDRPGLAALVTVALYAARPDTALLTMGALVAVRWGRGLRPVLAAPLLGAVGIGGLLVLFQAYYGSALPMAFYLKSGQSGLYDGHFLEVSRGSKHAHLAFLAVTVAPVVYVLAHGRAAAAWRWALPAVAFIAYHALFTVEVMGMHARFYAPAIPPLAMAAGMAWPAYRRRQRSAVTVGFVLAWGTAVAWAYGNGLIATDEGWPIGRMSALAYAGYVVAGGVALLAALPGRERLAAWVWAPIALGLSMGNPSGGWSWPSDRAYLDAHQTHVTSYRGIERLVRCLGTDIDVYHSEIGVVGLVFLHGNVTDLGGLMTPALTRGETTFDAMCQRQRPEAIFLPHRNYRTLNRTIAQSACLQDYERVFAESSSPLYVRRDLVATYRCAEGGGPAPGRRGRKRGRRR